VIGNKAGLDIEMERGRAIREEGHCQQTTDARGKVRNNFSQPDGAKV
jgi:hypothetical protein